MVSRCVPRLPSRFTPGYHGFHSPLRPEKNLTGNRQMAKKKRKPPRRSPNRAFRSRPKSYSPPELPDRRAIEGVMKGFLGEMLGGPAAGTPLAWIPMEEERPNENASALPENSNIFALSAPWSLCGSKSYRGVSREVSRSIVYSAFVVPDPTGLQVLKKCRVSGRRHFCHPTSFQGRGCENGRSTEDPASGS